MIVRRGEGLPRPSVFDRLDHMAAAGFRPSTVVDVGAAFGTWTADCRATFPNARYILVEPNPVYHEALAKETLIAAAAGSVNERRSLLLPFGSHRRLLPCPRIHREGTSTTRSTLTSSRLDDVITEPVDLLKLDVQGFEIEAMNGAPRILSDCEVLVAECSLYPFQRDIPLIHDVVAYVVDKGFRVYDYGGEFRWSSKTLAQMDLVFVREDSEPAEKRAVAMKKALITGVTGQDGSYLSELLLSKGYEVHGLIRRSSSFNTQRLDDIYRDPHESGVRFLMHYGDLSDSGSLINLIRNLEPDEIYHLGAQSHVKVSFDIPEYTADTTAMGAIRILEAIRASGVQTRFYQASSSEMFGAAPPPQSEATPFYPRSPYGVSKVFAYWATVNYREAYGMYACNGILFNHESVRRGETFVTRKITRAVARIKAGLQDKLYLGNLEARRDWGFAPEYVEAMWRMLQQDDPEDFVIATGEAHSVQEFVELAFERADLDWRSHVEVDPRYLRPAEVDDLRGDASKAEKLLGWRSGTRFDQLVALMVDGDVQLLGDEMAGRMVRVDRDHVEPGPADAG